MIVSSWRIFKPQYAATAFTGEGARRFGGRWNSKRSPIVYTAGSAALAALEMLVHLSSQQLLQTYHLCEVTFDEELISAIDPASLPSNWRSDPPPLELRQMGDAWLTERAAAILQVPSALIERESNYLINPVHPDFGAVRIGPTTEFVFDPRLRK